MKLLGQNILEKCLSKFFAKAMYSRNGFPGNSRFGTKVRPHFFRRQYSRNVLSGHKKERTNLQYFIHTTKWNTQKTGRWTDGLDTYTLDT